MITLKRSLNGVAATLRLMSKAITHWPWVLLILCILSPVSPHVRLPYSVSYSDCAYIGTRGVMRPTATDCPLITIINTGDAEIVQW